MYVVCTYVCNDKSNFEEMKIHTSGRVVHIRTSSMLRLCTRRRSPLYTRCSHKRKHVVV